MKASNMLYCNELTKVYVTGGGFSRSRLVAVNKASFSLSAQRPEILTLAGESGSGKTTVSKLILGFEEPTSGTILYKGRLVSSLRKRQERLNFMREVQPVFQNPFETFNPLRTVDRYLFDTEANFNGTASRLGRQAAVEEALEMVGLSLQEVKGRYPSEMSGGQLQRISLARSLITHPTLLVADEPVSMIDASLRMSVVNLFRELKQQSGVSVIYITHDLATAYYVSDRIAVMLRGCIVEMGTVEQVLETPLHPYTQILKESVPVPDPDNQWEGEIELTDLEVREYNRRGCRFAGRCPEVMEICRKAEPLSKAIAGRSVMCHLY